MSKLDLNEKLLSIGIRLSNSSSGDMGGFIDIEDIIYQASLTVPKDGRLFSLLCSWVEIHGSKVIINKLMTRQKKKFSPWLVALAVFAESRGLHPWKRLIKKLPKQLFFVSLTAARSQIKRGGNIPGMKERNIYIAKNEIRNRAKDIYSIEELMRSNRQYRNRFLYGACIRSDIITLIEEGVPNPYQIAKKLGCSQGPAYRIFKEYKIVRSIAG